MELALALTLTVAAAFVLKIKRVHATLIGGKAVVKINVRIRFTR